MDYTAYQRNTFAEVAIGGSGQTIWGHACYLLAGPVEVAAGNYVQTARLHACHRGTSLAEVMGRPTRTVWHVAFRRGANLEETTPAGPCNDRGLRVLPGTPVSRR